MLKAVLYQVSVTVAKDIILNTRSCQFGVKKDTFDKALDT